VPQPRLALIVLAAILVLAALAAGWTWDDAAPLAL
jgi:hypothetical protein